MVQGGKIEEKASLFHAAVWQRPCLLSNLWGKLTTMFSIRTCNVPGCRRHAVERSETCFDHIPDQQTYLSDLRAWMASKRELSGLAMARIPWSGEDFRGRSFEGCNFTGAQWSD